MKINVGNSEILKNGGLKLSQKAKTGVILLIGLGFGAAYGLHLDAVQKDLKNTSSMPSTSYGEFGEFPSDIEILEPYSQEDPINVSLEQINSLNIIINDCNCSDEFITEVCEELSNDGIKFSFSRGCKNVDVDNAVVITLDQQYMAGPGTAIFAPYENGRLGNSDALALAAERGFHEKGFITSNVACGQIGFRENEDGSVSERVPTATEEAIGKDKNTSFVTISFGTQNTNAKLTASSIENMLTRYYAYVTAGNDEDLVYCVENDDNYESIAEKIGSTVLAIDEYNNTSDEKYLLPGEAIVHPRVKERREFDRNVPTNLYVDKTLWSK